ncbi:MAG: autotransporter outer membrane beta-barrel domain-containing protein, partial [Chlamydiae bacterium]|nr:autotransporter outer membrane beta-barrel domain-containing protein [Chlamydiota bacterium]
SVDQLQEVLDASQPAQIKALAISQENNAVKVRDTLSVRLNRELDAMHCRQDKSGSCFVDARELHVWATGFGDNLHQGNVSEFGFGFQDNTGGFSAGADYHFADVMYVGALGAYTSSDVSWTHGLGSEDITSGYAGLYVSALSKTFFGTVAVLGGWSDYSGFRKIKLPVQDYRAYNSHSGSQILTHADTGVNFGIAGFTIRPFDSFNYISQTENGYSEKGKSGFNLNVKSQNSIMIRNELGVNFAGCFCVVGGQWTVSPKISWVREVRVKGKTIHASFDESNCSSYTFDGYFPSRSL